MPPPKTYPKHRLNQCDSYIETVCKPNGLRFQRLCFRNGSNELHPKTHLFPYQQYIIRSCIQATHYAMPLSDYVSEVLKAILFGNTRLNIL